MWNTHKDKIKEVTGVNNIEDYKKNPTAQEKYQNYLGKQYKADVVRFKSKYNLSVPDETLMMLDHFLGAADAEVYLNSLNNSKALNGKPDYDKAQQDVNDSIKSRTGSIPKNVPIKDYLNNFNNKLKNLK